MSDEKLKAEVESILFASAKITQIEELVKLTNAKEKDIREAIKSLTKDYEGDKKSLSIVDYEDAWKLTVKDKYMPFVEKVITETELPKSILETLSVIAFKHPILQSDVVKIRSNKAYDHIKVLEETGFVKRERFGRTNKIHLTQKFFDYFDLPPSKIKEAFSSFNAVAKAIDEQEKEIDEMNTKIVESQTDKKEKLGKLEVYKEKFNEPKKEDFIDKGTGEESGEEIDTKFPRTDDGEYIVEQKETDSGEVKNSNDEQEETDSRKEIELDNPTKENITNYEQKETDSGEVKNSNDEQEEEDNSEKYVDKTPEQIQAEIEQDLKDREDKFEGLSGEQLEVANLKRKITDRANDLLKGKDKEKDKESKDLDSLYDDLEDTKHELKN